MVRRHYRWLGVEIVPEKMKKVTVSENFRSLLEMERKRNRVCKKRAKVCLLRLKEQ